VKLYQTYLIGADGRLRLGERFSCMDDGEAVARFQGAGVRNAELWQGGRPVAAAGADGGLSDVVRRRS
jgi:hypothetical protein